MRRHSLSLAGLLLVLSASLCSAQILYGGNGGHSGSVNNGSLVLVDQNTAAISLVGHPGSVERLPGLAFDLSGTLFGSTLPGGGFPPPPPAPLTSTLITINPLTGALISDLGPITDVSTGLAVAISELAVQPGTNTLFGISAPVGGSAGGTLYTINKATAAATPVGNTGFFFDTIAFAPDGTLYLSSANLGPRGAHVDIGLRTLDPTNASVLTTVATADFFGALAVRPTDGAIFASTGDEAMLFTVNPLSGVETPVGSTGDNFVGSLAFAPVPEPGAVSLFLGCGVVGSLISLRRRLRRR